MDASTVSKRTNTIWIPNSSKISDAVCQIMPERVSECTPGAVRSVRNGVPVGGRQKNNHPTAEGYGIPGWLWMNISRS